MKSQNLRKNPSHTDQCCLVVFFDVVSKGANTTYSPSWYYSNFFLKLKLKPVFCVCSVYRQIQFEALKQFSLRCKKRTNQEGVFFFFSFFCYCAFVSESNVAVTNYFVIIVLLQNNYFLLFSFPSLLFLLVQNQKCMCGCGGGFQFILVAIPQCKNNITCISTAYLK